MEDSKNENSAGELKISSIESAEKVYPVEENAENMQNATKALRAIELILMPSQTIPKQSVSAQPLAVGKGGKTKGKKYNKHSRHPYRHYVIRTLKEQDG